MFSMVKYKKYLTLAQMWCMELMHVIVHACILIGGVVHIYIAGCMATGG